MRLQNQAGLTGAMHRLCSGGPPPSEDDFHRLHGAGLVSRQIGKIVPANLLYARFFKSIR